MQQTLDLNTHRYTLCECLKLYDEFKKFDENTTIVEDSRGLFVMNFHSKDFLKNKLKLKIVK